MASSAARGRRARRRSEEFQFMFYEESDRQPLADHVGC
jgi:hypothetical protein